VAGLRTFILIALMGALSATLANHYGPSFAIVAFAALTILVGIGCDIHHPGSHDQYPG